MEDVVVMTLVKFIVTGIIVSAFLMGIAFLIGIACGLKASAWALKAAEEEARRREENDDK